MWLKKEGIFDQVKANVESQGEEFDFEIDNFYVSDVLKALMKQKTQCVHLLRFVWRL